MALFFQILLGVVVGIALIIVIAVWWIKRWVVRATRSYGAASKLLDPRWLYPARIRLQQASEITWGKAAQSLWQQFGNRGFWVLGDLEDASGTVKVRAAHHESLSVALALTEYEEDQAFFTLFGIRGEKDLVAVSTEPGAEVRSERFTWLVDENATVDSAWSRIRGSLEGNELRKIDMGLFREAWQKAYAARADLGLGRKPVREMIEHRALAQQGTPTNEQLEKAYDILVRHWQGEVEVSVLDRYRRSSRIDAVTWEQMGNDLQVVHGHLSSDEIARLLVDDEVSRQILKQCSAQGYEGIELYEEVMERLPANRRRMKVGQVDRPFRAVIYGPTGQGTGNETLQYVYESMNADGKKVHGAVMAANVRDAKEQLAKMGLASASILVEPVPMNGPVREDLFDPELAAMAAKANQESLITSVVRALAGNVWIWGPPAALLSWIVPGEEPLGWGDFAAISYAVIALAALVFLIAPMVLYNQLLRARVTGRWKTARMTLAVLERINLFGGLSKSALSLERAKLFAAEGKIQQALEAWRTGAADLQVVDYQSGLGQIYDAAGERGKLIESQRAVLDLSQDKSGPSIDLAMSLARYTDNTDEAESLLGGFSPTELSELVAAGYNFTRGLIAANRSAHELALRHYTQAIEQFKRFKGNPLVLGVIAEVNAYAAVSLKHLGQVEQAEQLWRQVWPVLRVHRGSQLLAKAYEAA